MTVLSYEVVCSLKNVWKRISKTSLIEHLNISQQKELYKAIFQQDETFISPTHILKYVKKGKITRCDYKVRK
jgi:hypothetical protein